MNNWGLTVSNPLSLDRTGESPVWDDKQKNKTSDRTERSNDQNLRSDIKSLIGKLKSLIQIQIHPVLPLHSLIKLWRMRTIRTCHVCHFLSPSFFAATSVATPGPNLLTESHLGWIMKFSFKHISNTFWKSHFGLGWMPREEEKATRWMCLRRSHGLWE